VISLAPGTTIPPAPEIPEATRDLGDGETEAAGWGPCARHRDPRVGTDITMTTQQTGDPAPTGRDIAGRKGAIGIVAS
jgi:hypothetical protein